MLDRSMVLWYARPSATYPTVEIRVADVCLAAGDSTLVAALVRGLVDTAAAASLAGRAVPVVPEIELRAAHASAARDGLDGTLIDARSGRARRAWDLVDDLVSWTAPALRRHGDLDAVTTGLDRLRREGTGAARQRRLLAAGGVARVLDELGRLTRAASAAQ
jgi:carboxylate-amine ligase